MTGGANNAFWCGAFLDELARIGVRFLCVAPGSRSTPLVLAAAQDGRFQMVSVIDERSAGFLALGVGKASGSPAAVITTSGTAAANLYPAVIEASQGEVPLLVLTADRPHRLRDTDGNQAMDQIRLFGNFPRAFFEVSPPLMEDAPLRHLRSLAARAVSLAVGPPAGPVHLNFPFEKPLEPELDPSLQGVAEGLETLRGDHPLATQGRPEQEPFVRVTQRLPSVVESDLDRVVGALESSEKPLFVAGPNPQGTELGPALFRLAEARGIPILADPLSGARFGPPEGVHVVGRYDLFLRSAKARRALVPDLILRVGGSPTSAALLQYLGDHGRIRQIVLDSGGRWKDHLASAHDYLQTSPPEFLHRLADRVSQGPDSDWREDWSRAEAQTEAVLDGLGPGELLEGEILAAVVSGLPPGANLFVASSMPVRDLDAFVSKGPEGLRVYGNRGVSGIDGLVSTTHGIALGTVPEVAADGAVVEVGSGAGATVGVLGDLAFLHDTNGLLALRSLRTPLVLVVVNNDGGGIFHTLPVRDHEPAFTSFFATPHGLGFQGLAEFHGVGYARAESLGDLKHLLAGALGEAGPFILEIRTRREETHARRKAVAEAVVQEVDGIWDR